MANQNLDLTARHMSGRKSKTKMDFWNLSGRDSRYIFESWRGIFLEFIFARKACMSFELTHAKRVWVCNSHAKRVWVLNSHAQRVWVLACMSFEVARKTCMDFDFVREGCIDFEFTCEVCMDFAFARPTCMSFEFAREACMSLRSLRCFNFLRANLHCEVSWWGSSWTRQSLILEL